MHIAIIGNGIAGVTAARHIRKLSAHSITIISAETNYFFSRTALMYVYMGHMKFEQTQPYENGFWEKNNIGLKNGKVTQISHQDKTLHFAGGDTMQYDKLIIATGSISNKYGWPGQDLKGVMGLYSKQDLDMLEACTPDTTSAVVVGGGLIGIELAEMLRARNIKVTMLVREESFWNLILPKGESEMINHHIISHHIQLKLASELKEIVSDSNGRVKEIITNTGEIIPCQIVGLAVGVSPNIDFIKSSAIDTDKGVLVNRFLETNINDIYTIGDCAQQQTPIGNRRSIEAVWYTGRMMGETVAQTICGNRTAYQPGHWFNSAKFLDIEYQTYGWVSAQPTDNEIHFHWKHTTEDKCITVAYEKQSRKFLGINTFGIRMKHAFFDDALTKGMLVDEVMSHLHYANFDPEFYKTHEQEIQRSFLNGIKTTV